MGLLGLGVGTLNCVIFGFWPTWRNIWNVLTKPLFIISGMFYTFESLPPQAQAVLWYNPLIHAVGLIRGRLLRRLRAATTSRRSTCSAIAGSLFVIGAYLLRRHASALLER